MYTSVHLAYLYHAKLTFKANSFYYRHNAVATVVYYNLQSPSKLPYKYRGVFSSEISGLTCLQLTKGQCYILRHL